jgi:hypothetical protein
LSVFVFTSDIGNATVTAEAISEEKLVAWKAAKETRELNTTRRRKRAIPVDSDEESGVEPAEANTAEGGGDVGEKTGTGHSEGMSW